MKLVDEAIINAHRAETLDYTKEVFCLVKRFLKRDHVQTAVPQLGLVNVSTALRAARSIIDSGNEQIRIREDIAI